MLFYTLMLLASFLVGLLTGAVIVFCKLRPVCEGYLQLSKGVDEAITTMKDSRQQATSIRNSKVGNA